MDEGQCKRERQLCLRSYCLLRSNILYEWIKEPKKEGNSTNLCDKISISLLAKNKILKLLSKSNILFFKVLKKNYLVSFNMGNSELYINLILDKVRGFEVPRTTFCGYQICGPIGFIKGVVTLHKTAGFYSEHANDIHFDSILYQFLLMKSIGKSFYL